MTNRGKICRQSDFRASRIISAKKHFSGLILKTKSIRVKAPKKIIARKSEPVAKAARRIRKPLMVKPAIRLAKNLSAQDSFFCLSKKSKTAMPKRN